MRKHPTQLTEGLRQEISDWLRSRPGIYSLKLEAWRMSHAHFLAENLGDLAGARVVDVGCGTGRFARFLSDRNPTASIWCVDASPEVLQRIPPSPKLTLQTAWMTELPFQDEFFDVAFAIESLTHAVEIEVAVREICRVVKKGGKIVIIDKNVEDLGRFWMPYWDQLFSRIQLEAILRKYARTASSQYLPHRDPNDKSDLLFIGWTATK